MKRLTFAAVILILLLGVSLLTGSAIQQMSEQYVQQLTTAQELAGQGDWEQARTITGRVFQSWNDRGFFLHTLLRHGDTDQILLSFCSVEEYLRLEEMDEYAAANAALITQLKLIAEMEAATLENVL